MKNTFKIAVAVFMVVSGLVVASFTDGLPPTKGIQSGKNYSDNNYIDCEQNPSIIIKEHYITISDGDLEAMEIDNEHNGLVGRGENTSVYLDNTSPETDTLHIYIYR